MNLVVVVRNLFLRLGDLGLRDLLLSLSQRQLNIYDVYMSYRNERGGCVTRASEWAGRARVRRSDARARRLRGEERGRDA